MSTFVASLGFFTATGTPAKVPRYTVEQPPTASTSCTCTSLAATSTRTPEYSRPRTQRVTSMLP